MRTLMPWRTERGRYFHAHPQQAITAVRLSYKVLAASNSCATS